MRPPTPVFEFGETYTATVPIGTASIEIQVKRFTKAEREAYEQQFASHVGGRGVDNAPKQDSGEEFIAFAEQSLRENVTLEEGWLKDRGAWVTTGDGVIGMFGARPDILAEFLGAILFANRLNEIARKNSKSPRVFGSGLTASTPTRGEPVTGVEPESIAEPASERGSASDEDAMASSSPNASSGLLLEAH